MSGIDGNPDEDRFQYRGKLGSRGSGRHKMPERVSVEQAVARRQREFSPL